MAVSDITVNYIQEMFVANWSMLRENNGLLTWLKWLKSDDVDDYCANQAMRSIIQQRIDSGRLDPMKDKPKLIEFQAVYFKTKKERESSQVVELQEQDCPCCRNFGYLYIVVHTNSYISEETPIKQIPQEVSALRRFCYHYTLPCTCPRGEIIIKNIQESCKKDGRWIKPVTVDKRSYMIGKWSMYHEDAQRLVNAYIKHRMQVFNPKSKKQLDKERSDADIMFKCFMRSARKRLESLPQDEPQAEPQAESKEEPVF